MALSIVLCAMANSPYVVENQLAVSTPKVVKKLNSADVATHKVAKQAKFNQQDREAIAAKRMAKATPALQVNGARQIEAVQTIAKQAMSANAVRKAPAKAAAEIVAKDTVEFVAAAWNYQYYEDTQDWWMAVIDETGTYRLDFDYVVPVENFAGTYTIENLDLNYSYLTTIDEEGYKKYVKYVSAEFTVTDNAEGKSLVANVLCEDSVRYLVTAVELPLPEAKDTVELAYTNGHLEDGTRSSETFQFWADENGVYTSLLIASEQVEGEYTEKDMYVDYANYILFVDGTDSTFVDFLGLNLTVTKEDLTYFADAYALGVDTIMYHITMSYTKPAPADTIDIVATNMAIDEFEFWGMYFCTITASNEEYTVTLDMKNGLPLGELTSADFNVEWSSVYRTADATEIVFDDILSATVTEVDGQRAIKAQALGVDTILYNLDLSYVLPTATDTVEVVFTTPASAEYYDSEGDYYIYNANEEYIVTLDIYAEANALEGEYEGEDFYLYYTRVGLIVDGDTTAVSAAAAKATVTKVSEELAHIDAELLCENEVLYLVSTDVTMSKVGLQYDMTEGEVNREYNLNDELTITTDYVADYGQLYVDIMAGDMSDLVSLMFFVNDTVEGLVVPAGTYPISDTYAEGTALASTGYDDEYGAMPSNYCTLVADGGSLYLDELYFMVGGNVVVEHVDGHLKITIDAVNSYDVPAHIVYEAVEGEKVYLQYDAEEGAIDRAYTTEEITLTPGNGYFQILAYAADATDMVGMVVFGENDENTIIPVGTYTINGTQTDGTVLASTGVNSQGQISMSFYGKTNAQGQITPPCYFFVGGTVEVSAADGMLKLEVNAVNSYDVPVHIVMEYDLNTKQGLQYDMTEGEVNRTYSDADVVVFTTDYVAEYGELYLKITAADGSDMISVAFSVEAVDSAITIPAGTYPINDTGATGTVFASSGVVDGSIYPSFYGQLGTSGGIKVPCYFMVGGNVVVENVDGHLKVTIDALNSYDVPAHIVYEADPIGSAIENVTVDTTNASKMIENDQLLIIKDGVKYNVMGSVVK